MENKQHPSLVSITRSLIALAGAAVSAILLREHLAVRAGKGIALALCESGPDSGCRLTALSVYAEWIPHVPTPALALAFFLVAALPRKTDTESAWLAMQGFSCVVSFFYLWVMVSMIRQACWGCITLHALNFSLLILQFFSRLRLRTAPVPTSRTVRTLATISIQMLVLTTATAFALTFLPQKRMDGFSQTREAPPVSSGNDYTFELGRGSRKTEVTAVIDPACPYCRENLLNLDEAATANGYRVRVNFYLIPQQEDCTRSDQDAASCTAARIGICRAKSGNFEKFIRETFLRSQTLIPNPALAVEAEESDPQKRRELLRCVESEETALELERFSSLRRGSEKNMEVNVAPTSWASGIRYSGRLYAADWIEVLAGRKLKSRE